MASLLYLTFLLGIASRSVLSDPIGESKGPLCFFCQSVENPDDCETIISCSEHEKCYTERYISKENHEFFRLGCKADPICTLLENFQNSHGTTGTNCLSCCKGDYCNQNTCRNSTLDRIQCYTCDNVLTPHECEAVTTCDYDEVCAAEEIVTDEFEIRYNVKCKQKQACALLGEPSVIKPVGKRQDELCDQCCTTAFCNRGLCGATQVTYTVAKTSVTPNPSTGAPSGSTSDIAATSSMVTTRVTTETTNTTTLATTTTNPSSGPTSNLATPNSSLRPTSNPTTTTSPSGPTTTNPATTNPSPSSTTNSTTENLSSKPPTTNPATTTPASKASTKKSTVTKPETDATSTFTPSDGLQCFQCAKDVFGPSDCTDVQTCESGEVCLGLKGLTDSHQHPIIGLVRYKSVGCCSTSRCRGLPDKAPTSAASARATSPGATPTTKLPSTRKNTAAPTTASTTATPTSPSTTTKKPPTSMSTSKATTPKPTRKAATSSPTTIKTTSRPTTRKPSPTTITATSQPTTRPTTTPLPTTKAATSQPTTRPTTSKPSPTTKATQKTTKRTATTAKPRTTRQATPEITATPVFEGPPTCYGCPLFDERAKNCTAIVGCINDDDRCFVGRDQSGKSQSLCLPRSECDIMSDDILHHRQYYHEGVRYRQGRCCDLDLCNAKL